MPFISEIIQDNCQTENCPEPYSFHHSLPLTKNSSVFQESVSKARISGEYLNDSNCSLVVRVSYHVIGGGGVGYFLGNPPPPAIFEKPSKI